MVVSLGRITAESGSESQSWQASARLANGGRRRARGPCSDRALRGQLEISEEQQRDKQRATVTLTSPVSHGVGVFLARCNAFERPANPIDLIAVPPVTTLSREIRVSPYLLTRLCCLGLVTTRILSRISISSLDSPKLRTHRPISTHPLRGL